jgi:hypothetical protein
MSTVICLATSPTPSLAQHACGDLTVAQVTTLLGTAPTSKETAHGKKCVWTATTGAGTLRLLLGPADEAARGDLNQMWDNPGTRLGGTIRRQPGLGDRAVSVTIPSGVRIIVVKGTRSFVLSYTNQGVAPTARQQERLRALAAVVASQP